MSAMKSEESNFTANIQPHEVALSEAEQTQRLEAERKVRLNWMSLNIRLRQGLVHANACTVDDMIHPELIYGGLLREIVTCIHQWWRQSKAPDDVNAKMAKGLLSCLIKCCKATKTRIDRQDAIVGEKFDAKRMTCLSVEEDTGDFVTEKIAPALLLNGTLIAKALVRCVPSPPDAEESNDVEAVYTVPDLSEKSADPMCHNEVTAPDDGLIVQEADTLLVSAESEADQCPCSEKVPDLSEKPADPMCDNEVTTPDHELIVQEADALLVSAEAEAGQCPCREREKVDAE